MHAPDGFVLIVPRELLPHRLKRALYGALRAAHVRRSEFVLDSYDGGQAVAYVRPWLRALLAGVRAADEGCGEGRAARQYRRLRYGFVRMVNDRVACDRLVALYDLGDERAVAAALPAADAEPRP